MCSDVYKRQAWGSYETLQFEISNPELLDGKHDVYFVFKGTTEDSRPVSYTHLFGNVSDSLKLKVENSNGLTGKKLKSTENIAKNKNVTASGRPVSYTHLKSKSNHRSIRFSSTR